MCAVTDKVWTIKGVLEGGTPFTTLAPLQISNETFTGTWYHFHTLKRLSGSVAHCLRLVLTIWRGGFIATPRPPEWALIFTNIFTVALAVTS